MRLLVTGSRNWTNEDLVIAMLYPWARAYGRDLELVNGGAPGLDTIACDVWGDVYMGPTLTYPAQWDKHGRAAGPIRNQAMVDLGSYLACLAFPLGQSYGTRDCMAKARKAGIPVLEVS